MDEMTSIQTPSRRTRCLWCLAVLSGCAMLVTSCSRREEPPSKANQATSQSQGADVRGDSIISQPVAIPTALPSDSAAAPRTSPSSPVVKPDGTIQLSFARLSDFVYEVHEVHSETNTGRPFLKSDNVIPERVKEFDSKRVEVTGFVMPMRTKKGLVTEFLLMRDQGACCFGQYPQLNHYMRVRTSPGKGFTIEGNGPYRVMGVLHVGEIYVQGYLTGIYSMDAENLTQP